MIHYIDGKPSKNIKLSKSKAHAVQAYRQSKAVAQRRELVIEIISGIVVIGLGIVLLLGLMIVFPD